MRAPLASRIGVAAAAVFLVVAATAFGAGGSYQSASLKFTTDLRGHSTGTRLRINYVNPTDPRGKPVAVRRVVQTFARGSRFDTSAPIRCAATDAQLMAQGPSACPDGSMVGGGFLTVDTGFPAPGRFLAEDVTAINADHELIFLTRDRKTGAYLSSRFEVHRRTIIAETPPLPGTPPDGGAVDRVRVHLRPVTVRRDGRARRYISTPRQCPAGGHWTNRIAFTYSDGVKQTVKSRSRCEAS
jgi:hypothetical protein